MSNFFEDRKIPAGILRRPLRALFVLLIIILAAFAIRAFLRFSNSPPLPRFEHSLAVRQLEALRDYAARHQKCGALFPSGDAVIAIREEFLQNVIDRSLPLQQIFEEGRYLVRLDKAAVKFEEGLAVVNLSGRGMLADGEDSPLYVDLLLQSIFSIPQVDPASGILQARLVITNVEVRRVGSLAVLGPLHPVFYYFSHLQVEEWNRLGDQIQLPLKIDRAITFPAIRGDVQLPETRIPISVRVSGITTLQRRMAVSLALLPDSMFGEFSTAEFSDGQAGTSLPAQNDTGRTDLNLKDAAKELDALRAQISAYAGQDQFWQGVIASNHDVVAIVPLSILKILATRVSRNYLAGVTIDIQKAAAAKINAALHTKVLGQRIGVGRIVGAIHIAQLRGEFAIAGNPRVKLVPPRELEVTIPGRMLNGRGVATLDVKWDPAMLTSVVCGGFEVQEKLAGTILPFREELTTRVEFSVQDSNIVGRTRVQRDYLKLKTDLAESSWNKVANILAEQDVFSRCGIAMNADTALAKLKDFGHAGIKIRLPAKMFQPFKLPVTLHTNYRAGNYLIEASASDPAIAISPDYLRLAFQTILRVRPLPSSDKEKG